MAGTDTTDASEDRWEGLDATWDVGSTVEDLSRVAGRLRRLEADSYDPRLTVHLRHATGGLALTVNALFASGDVKCTLDQPPEDVTTRSSGPGGDMIAKCFHDPPHCWDGAGRRVNPCP